MFCRYISCRGGRPIIFSCENTLYFDYILQSCTFKKDARCIGVDSEVWKIQMTFMNQMKIQIEKNYFDAEDWIHESLTIKVKIVRIIKWESCLLNCAKLYVKKGKMLAAHGQDSQTKWKLTNLRDKSILVSFYFW